MKPQFLNNPLDIASDFQQLENEFFIPVAIKQFDKNSGKGKLEWQYNKYQLDWFFNKIDKHLAPQTLKSAPFQDYDTHPQCDFDISFISSRTIRLRMKTSATAYPEKESLMINKQLPEAKNIKKTLLPGAIKYQLPFGSVVFNTKHFSLQFFNSDNQLLTATQTAQSLKGMHSKAMPFCFIKRSADYSRSVAASFSLLPGEKIFGCGESFTRLDKRGQKICLMTSDTQSTASSQMYKPIPFFMSSRGYGMFVHSSTPLTFDFGYTHQSTTTLYNGDEELDLFFFFGTPKEILSEYTALTGRSPLPPIWSFGLWMGTFSFTSQKQVCDVAMKMRKKNFPCDVIHIDAGWFEKGINCDFRFNKKKFPHPQSMMKSLLQNGFRVSLWQIPYFTPHNPLYKEIIEKKLYIKNAAGHIPTEDAILDLTNADTIKWYAEKLSALLKMGASVIKADFGEATPLHGLYASGTTGFYEHNLYPLRYNKLISELTKKETGQSIIWARSAWAGSQKYPVHWGGDAEISDAGMAGTLRGGLSLGLSGFSFWSHDIGGFSGSPVEELYARWSFFGLLSSHSRVHGFPPREPWKFSKQFQHQFRKISELRYRLLPYIYSQACISSREGLPLMKTLFLNYPNDPSTWNIEDEYLLGDDLLIAPLMEQDTAGRLLYLPEGKWIDLQSKKIYEGKQWVTIIAGQLPGIIMVRYGALIPCTGKIKSTCELDWKKLQWYAFCNNNETAQGYLFAPGMKNPIKVKSINQQVVNSSKEKSSFIIKNYSTF